MEMMDIGALRSRMSGLLTFNVSENGNLILEKIQDFNNDKKRPTEATSASSNTILKPATKSNDQQCSNSLSTMKSDIEKERYEEIQSIFRAYPGLFSFESPVDSYRLITDNVWCNQCGRQLPLANLHFHVRTIDHRTPISINHHKPYQKVIPLIPITKAVEGEKPESVVPLIPFIKPAFPKIELDKIFRETDNPQMLLCTVCNAEVKRDNRYRHLKSVKHKNCPRKVRQNLRAKLGDVALALMEKIFIRSSSSSSSNKLYCTICEIELTDSVANLSVHLLSADHIQRKSAKMMKELSKNKDIGDVNESDNDGDPGLRRDLAKLFAENGIPLSKYAKMRPFFAKYIKKSVPKNMFCVRKRKLEVVDDEAEPEAGRKVQKKEIVNDTKIVEKKEIIDEIEIIEEKEMIDENEIIEEIEIIEEKEISVLLK